MSKVATQKSVDLPHLGELPDGRPLQKFQYFGDWTEGGLGKAKEERILGWVPTKDLTD